MQFLGHPKTPTNADSLSVSHPHISLPLPLLPEGRTEAIMAASLQAAATLMQPGKVGGRRFYSPSNIKGVGFVCGRANCNSHTSFASFALPTSALLAPIENAILSELPELQLDSNETLIESADTLQQIDDKTSITSNIAESSPALPDSFQLKTGSSSSSTGIEETLSNLTDSLQASTSKGEDVLNSSIDKVTSSINEVLMDVNEVADSIANRLLSSIAQTKELADDRLSSLSGDLQEGASKVGSVAVDLLRQTIITAEDYVLKGAKVAIYSYASVKELLPPEIQSALSLSEEKTREISMPIGLATQQILAIVERLISSLGLDPSDPLVPFVIVLGSSSAIWVIYWVATYSGYAGDLSPNMTMEFLQEDKDSLLIDVRPEVLRERDGVPDLRRGVRFRYASVSLPEVDSSVQKLLKSRRELDDALVSIVIRNLKIVQDRSKIIVMDADGTRSKGIARSLRKLGMGKPYRVQGGFEDWVKQGFRIKELKPENALTIINEDAEAILEELAPSPLQLAGVGMGSVAVLYALIEWEKSLQLIGIVGLGLTIYLRVSSYEDSEDFKKDLRILLSPIELGAQAVSWTAGKLESNGIALPTSPSSTDVQSRVLQAAAKHESQPSDGDGQDQLENDNVDFSEA